MDERTPSGSHELLLALAGRVDDDLLGWTRELVAVGEDVRAVELLTATLVADRTVLPAPIRTALVDAGRAARTDLDADALPPAGPDGDGIEHRFDAAPAGAGDVAGALQGLSARQLQGCRLQLTWRLTPAGAAPGPLPQPVVLVEVEPAGRPSDVLAYQLAVALERVGVHAAVEVLVPGHPLSAYHAAALRHARPVLAGNDRTDAVDATMPDPIESDVPPADTPSAEPRAPEDRSPELRPADALPVDALPADALPAEGRATGRPAGRTSSDEPGSVGHPRPRPRPLAMRPQPGPQRRGPSPLTDAMSRHPDPPEPIAAPGDSSGGLPTRRPTVTPISRAFLPRPLAREATPADGTPTPVSDDTDRHPIVPAGDAVRPVPDPVDEGRQPALVETSLFSEMQDPLNGPLTTPLMAPALEPRFPGRLHPVTRPVTTESTAGDGDSDRDSWAAEWRSGTWAMSPSALTDREPPTAADHEPAGDEPARYEPSASEPALLTPAAGPAIAESNADQPGLPPAGRPTVGTSPAAPVPRRSARHRYLGDDSDEDDRSEPPDSAQLHEEAQPAPDGPTPDARPDHHPSPRPEPAPLPRDGAAELDDGSELGLRPESLARLSDADRELLARLKAELVDARPQGIRRASMANGPWAGANGSAAKRSGTNGSGAGPDHHPDPPDLAG